MKTGNAHVLSLFFSMLLITRAALDPSALMGQRASGCEIKLNHCFLGSLTRILAARYINYANVLIIVRSITSILVVRHGSACMVHTRALISAFRERFRAETREFTNDHRAITGSSTRTINYPRRVLSVVFLLIFLNHLRTLRDVEVTIAKEVNAKVHLQLIITLRRFMKILHIWTVTIRMINY